MRYVVAPEQQSLKLIYYGTPRDDPAASPAYYVNRLPLDTAHRSVEIESIDSSSGPLDMVDGSSVNEVPLLVMAAGLANQTDAILRLRDYVESGGRVVFVMTDADSGQSIGQTASALLGHTPMRVDEAVVDDYAMLSRIDFTDPLFAAMADPQYNDFTKIRFWKHRQVQTLEDGWKVVAAFDNDDPAIMHHRLGLGDVYLLTAGWQPAESQWALSTKFLPMMSYWFAGNRRRDDRGTEIFVGDRLPWLTGEDTAPNIPVDEPGVYSYVAGGQPPMRYAVNLATSESQTEPMDVDALERLGVTLGRAEPAQQRLSTQRQRRLGELEARQRLWQWVLVAAIGALGIETYLGGRHAKRIA